MCQYIHQGTKIDFRLKKKTRREEADRLPAFHLEGSRARTRVFWLGANSTSQQSARASAVSNISCVCKT